MNSPDKQWVPGRFRCAKCNLGLTASTLYLQSGTIGVNNEPQECSNGCGPMWRVTWEQEAKELSENIVSCVDRYDEEIKKLKQEIKVLKKELREERSCTDFYASSRTWTGRQQSIRTQRNRVCDIDMSLVTIFNGNKEKSVATGGRIARETQEKRSVQLT